MTKFGANVQMLNTFAKWNIGKIDAGSIQLECAIYWGFFASASFLIETMSAILDQYRILKYDENIKAFVLFCHKSKVRACLVVLHNSQLLKKGTDNPNG